MTISTSSSTSHCCTAALALFALALVAGCGRGASEPAEAPQPRAEAPGPAPARPTPVPPSVPAPKRDIAALYTADLTQAVAGAKKLPFTANGDMGGMTCSPDSISGTDAASRTLTLTLPEKAAARRHVLAVVTPERGLLEIYSPYGDDSESEDIVVPSRTISWSLARTRNVFATNADKLDGLRPGSDTPEVLFLEAGRYRFALVNSIDPELLRSNGQTLKVVAACSFDWVP